MNTDQPLNFVPPWQGDGSHRIPFGVYTDAALHQRELERFFYRAHWSYVGLELSLIHILTLPTILLV